MEDVHCSSRRTGDGDQNSGTARGVRQAQQGTLGGSCGDHQDSLKMVLAEDLDVADVEV